MAKKRTSNTLGEAEARASALRSIEKQIDFGPDLSLGAYIEHINAARTRLGNVNDLSGRLDAERIGLRQAESVVRDMSSRILKLVQARFGADSDEYKMAGGTPRSERKRPVRRMPGSDPSAGEPVVPEA